MKVSTVFMILGGYIAAFGFLFLRIQWPRRCVWMRWHRWAHWERLSTASDRYRCSCGRHWAVNHEVGFAMPWEQARQIYDGPLSCRQFPPRQDERPS